MTMRQLTLTADPILSWKMFYRDENEFSGEFPKYLADNPLKQEFKKRIFITDLPLQVSPNSWKIISKSAQLINNPRFNISNNP